MENAAELEKELQKWQREFKKGFTKPIILLTLSYQESYPFQLTKIIRNLTKGQIEVATTNIYPILKQLADTGFINRREDADSPRTFYCITEKGQQFIKHLKEMIKTFFFDIEEILT
ncbi:MAG: PadR family transcriptional regulator [Candidatus Hermodarchaeota archaeon]